MSGRRAYALSCTLLALAVLTAAALHDVPLAGAQRWAPAIVLIGGFAQLGAAAALYVRAVQRPSHAVSGLAWAFGVLALIAIATGAATPFSAANAAYAHAFGLVWQLVFAVTIVRFVRMRRGTTRSTHRTRFTAARAVQIVATASVLLLAAGLCAHAAPDRFDTFNPVRADASAAAALLAAVAVVIAMVRLREVPDALDRALALATFDATFSLALLLWAPANAVPFYAAALGYAAVPFFVITGALRDVLGERDRRSDDDDARLEALWRLAARTDPDEARFMSAIIDEGARALRRERPLLGILVRVDGDDVVVVASHESAVGASVPAPGLRVPLRGTVTAEVLRRNRTCSWADVRTDVRLAPQFPWRTVIASPFRAGAVRYVLFFIALQPLEAALDGGDVTYVETLAAVCGARLEQRAQTRAVVHQREHDPLTGLPNRSAFRAAGWRALRAGGDYGVAIIDVDFFREINDAYGHGIGDAVIVEIASALQAATRPDDVLARLGGDAFGILMHAAEDRDALDARLRALLAAVQRPITTGRSDGRTEVRVTASAGVAATIDDGTRDFEELLTRADGAVYAAKDAGRARWTYAGPVVRRERSDAHRLHGELSRAIEADELVLHFQPHVELHTGRVAGVEALVRWNHPERGLLPPGTFVPFAERHGLSPALTTWVLREAVRRSARWRRNDGLHVWINVAPDDLAQADVVDAFTELDGRLGGMGVEITETAAMRDVAATGAVLARMRESGVRLALDDFGTGYSSLAQLKRLTFDVVKIDRSFLAGIPHDPQDVAIVEAVVAIAGRYGFTTVAEGVESLAQVALLANIGCDYAQGFVYAAPMAADAFDAWLRARRGITVTATAS